MHSTVEVHSATVVGVDAEPVIVRVRRDPSIRRLRVVGFPPAIAHELGVVVAGSLEKLGVSGSDLGFICEATPTPRRASGLALPVAVGLAAALGRVPLASLQQRRFYADLDFSGRLHVERGSVSVAELAASSHDCGVILGYGPAHPLPGGTLLATLEEVIDHLRGEAYPLRATLSSAAPPRPYCLSEVRGQEAAKRALEIAAAGGHHLAFVGPPGSGKTMLARRLPGLLPAPSESAAMEVARIFSAAGLPAPFGERPFRAPHHTVSAAGLTGGGLDPRPGEASLAHNGVLFLDELPEFSRTALDGLAGPLTTGRVHLGRSDRIVTIPARFQLVGAALPCPCGHTPCDCTPERVLRYRSHVPLAVATAFDLVCRVEPTAHASVASPNPGNVETSRSVAARVVAARNARATRLGSPSLNAALTGGSPASSFALSPAATGLAADLSDLVSLRALRVARTIADLAGSASVEPDHLDEALRFAQPFTAA